MFIDKFKPEFQLRKTPKNAEFRHFLYLPLFVMRRTDAQNRLDIHFNGIEGILKDNAITHSTKMQQKSG